MSLNYAIVPVREFSDSKLRLRSKLSSRQRKALTSSLLNRVASSLELSRMTAAIVVASDPSEVLDLVDDLPKIRVIQEDLHHGGVNRAMRTGIDFAKQEGATSVTLLPSDLPFISHDKIDAVLDHLPRYDLVINGSKKKDGTNLLSIQTSLDFVLHFDDNSFVKHIKEASNRKLNLLTTDFEEFSCDLDDFDDLNEAMRSYGAKSFGMFLEIVAGRGI
ncbi:MAG: 2-phospho-L-lactate guanylyltransferase [Nitrososphaerota archaeon]|nr:2-phospho-L-lactate guanylyltransferase [Nitrososphaerota archaeon]